MRRTALAIVVAGACAVGATPAAGQLQVPLPDVEVQLPDVQLPDVQLPLPEAPEVEVPEAPPPAEAPGTGGGTTSGGDGQEGGGGSRPAGPERGGGEQDGSCPCAAEATGNPVAGDYDKCPLDSGDSDSTVVLTAARSGGSDDGGADPAGRENQASAGGVLGAEASGPPFAEASSGGSGGIDLLPAAVLGLAGLGLIVGGAGGLRALHGRLRG